MELLWFSVLLDFLLIVLQHFVMAWFIGRFIRTRRMTAFCIAYVFLYTAIYAVFEYLLPEYKILKTILLPLLAIVLAVSFRGRSFLRSALHPALLHVLLLAADYSLMLLFTAVLPEHIDDLMTASYSGTQPIGTIEFSIICLLRLAGLLEMFPCLFITSLVLQEKNETEDAYDKRLNRFVPIIFLETLFAVFLMIYTARLIFVDTSFIWMMLGIMILFFLLDLFLIRIINSVESAEQLRHEKDEISLYAASHAVAYQQIMEGNTRLSMLRHDMLNELQTVGFLIDKGETDAAAEQLRFYAEEIRSTGKSITGNVIVDAVLSIKEHVCMESGIRLSVSGSIPANTPLNNSDLCGTVGNLLDNAIHGTADSMSSSCPDNPEIRFSAGVRDSKLVFSCKNRSVWQVSTDYSSPKPGSEHGWGLYILNQLAEKHGGASSITQDNGTVTATFWVPFSDGGQKDE